MQHTDDWEGDIRRFCSDGSATTCVALPTSTELNRWTVLQVRELLALRTDEITLQINRNPALVALAALPLSATVGSLTERVELGSHSWPASHGLDPLRLSLADAVEHVVREAFDQLHALRLKRLRTLSEALRARQDVERAARCQSDGTRADEKPLPARI